MSTIFWLTAIGFIMFFLTMKMYRSFGASLGVFTGLWMNTQLHINGLISIITMITIYFFVAYLANGNPRRG